MGPAEKGTPRSEEPVDQDREAWNLPGPPLVPVGPAFETQPADEPGEQGDNAAAEEEPLGA